MESVEEVKRKSKEKEDRFRKRYSYDFRLRAVKLRLEEGLPVPLLCKELGIGEQTLWEWLKRYRESGEGGLRDKVVVPGNRQKLPLAVRNKIIEIKKREPFHGVKRISQLLRRVFFLRASPETVRRSRGGNRNKVSRFSSALSSGRSGDYTHAKSQYLSPKIHSATIVDSLVSGWPRYIPFWTVDS